MAIPTQAELHRPILEIASSVDESLEPERVADLVSDWFNLSDEERQEKIPSGTRLIKKRTDWSLWSLKTAGLMHNPPRGPWYITQQGRNFLNIHKGKITSADLRQLHVASQQANDNATETADTGIDHDTNAAPKKELMKQVYQQLRTNLEEELLGKIKELAPDQFEQLVVNLLEEMGYGEGQVVGGSGDGGIDGIIDQDPLGLEKVYIQAKCWSNQVGEPVVRNFSGSLDPEGAAKGVLITTSTFSNTAEQTAQTISASGKFIRLIDGQELVKLMIQHGVGVVTESTYEIKKMDENYFAEDV